jgi:DNA polymerase-3 subunit epsilon
MDVKTQFQLLNEVYQRDNFVILDTETTGLTDGEIYQIAIINSEGRALLETLVKPVHGIPYDAYRIHGIHDENVKDAPSWRDVAPQVKSVITGFDVIVYNAVYDRKMMHQSAEKCGMEKIDWKTISPFYCAMEAYAEFYGEWNQHHGNYRWQRLTFAALHLNIPVEFAHSALGDCLMTLGVLHGMYSRGLE